MRLIGIIPYFFLMCYFNLEAQADLLNTKQKLISFRQSKISFGLGLEGGGAIFNGALPYGYQAKRDTNTLLAAAILIFDLDAPNSRLSFTSGVETSNQGLLFVSDSISNQMTLRFRQIHIPLFLKFKIGGKFSRSNLLFLLGGSYNIPITYSSMNGNGFVSKNINSIQNTYSWISSIVWQLNIRGEESAIGTNVPPRIWIYFKGSGLMKSLFNPQGNGNILDIAGSEEIDYRDLKLTFGIAYLFSGKKKHEVK